MEALLENDQVHPDELKRFEKAYYDQQRNGGEVANRTRFEYAWALVRSRYRTDVKRGIILLEDLCATGDDEAKRDYLFYLAVANTKIGELQRANECSKKFLTVEPQNRQAQELLNVIKERQMKEGLKGLAVAGGAAVVVGGLIGLGMALARK